MTRPLLLVAAACSLHLRLRLAPPTMDIWLAKRQAVQSTICAEGATSRDHPDGARMCEIVYFMVKVRLHT